MSPLRYAAQLLLHAVLLVAAAGMEPSFSPRGWQAARQAEQRRAQAAAATDNAAAITGAPYGIQQALPMAAEPQQQTCSLVAQPACPAERQVAWAQLASCGAVAFLCGMAAGMLMLHSWLQRQRRRRTTLGLGSQGMLLASRAGSCAVTEGSWQEERRHKQDASPAQLAPAGSEQGAAAAKALEEVVGETAADSKDASRERVVKAEGSSSNLEQCKPPSAEGNRGSEDVVPEQAAVAAVVHELVLQQGSGTGSISADAEVEVAVSSSTTNAAVKQQQQHHHQTEHELAGQQLPQQYGQQKHTQQEQHQGQQSQQGQEQREQGQEHEMPLQAVLGSDARGQAVVGGASHSGGGLAALRDEDRADIQAAAQLVLTMCSSMHVDPSQLDRGERVQLIYTMLQAWQAQQGRRHAQEVSRLGTEANELRSQQRDIAARQAARQAAKDAYRLSLERTADFRRMCSDTLTFGLVVMVAAGSYQLLSRGLLTSITASCGSVTAALGGRRWGLWAAWRAGEAVACYAFSIGDALLGLAVLLAAPWLVYRSGLLSDYHTMPVTKLFAGLGLICGLAGYLAVGKLGGGRGTWLAAWEAWVVLHIAFSAAAHRMQRIRLRAEQGGPVAESSMYEESGGWLSGLMWLVLGLVLPLLAGTLPFR